MAKTRGALPSRFCITPPVVDDIGVHHTGIEGTIETADEKPISKAMFTCVELGKSKTSDIVGHYAAIKMKPGTYTFTVTHPLYHSQSEVIKIKKGKIITKDWIMIPL